MGGGAQRLAPTDAHCKFGKGAGKGRRTRRTSLLRPQSKGPGAFAGSNLLAAEGPPAITIQTPTNGATGPPAFPAGGTVSTGIQNVMVTLESSLPGVPPVNQVVDGSSGFWMTDFAVDPVNYPGDSTLTATIVGLPVSTSITIQITP